MSISSDGCLLRTDAGEAERVPAIARDWVDAEPSSPARSSTFVRSGVFDFSVGDITRRLKASDSLVIPSNVEHGCRAIEEGSLIDTFAPRRDDFL